MTALVECSGVTHRFGYLLAVDDVDLRVDAGEVVGLLGANGAGKSTLIRILLGLLSGSEGQVLLFGAPPSRQTRRRLGYVPQGLGLYDDLSAEQNLRFAARAFGVQEQDLPPDLRDFAGVPVGRLPLGIQRRLAFVQAVAHGPDLLVLDEPTSGVGPLARARLWEDIHEVAASGSGVLVTTHHMDEAEECTRLVIMADGRVVARGSAAEIVGAAQAAVVETQDWQPAFTTLQTAGLPAALVGRTLRVPGAEPQVVRRALGGLSASVTQAPATLEERFLELTRARERTERRSEAR